MWLWLKTQLDLKVSAEYILKSFHVFIQIMLHIFYTFTHYHTASSQVKSLNTIPLSFFITPPRTRIFHTNYIFFSLILLSGDIQFNPGPVSYVSFLNMCTLNIRSFTHPLHYTAIADLADPHNIHVFALTETWISSIILHLPNSFMLAIPHSFTFISTPRLVSDSCTSSHLFSTNRHLSSLKYFVLSRLITGSHLLLKNSNLSHSHLLILLVI